MEFEIEFYEDEAGSSPVDEFLDDLKKHQPVLYNLLISGLIKLKNRKCHGEPLTKPIGDGLYELRVGKANIARSIWFFVDGATIIVVHGFVKKGNKLKQSDKAIALERKRDYTWRVSRKNRDMQ